MQNMFLSRIGLFYPPHLTYCSYNLLIISEELKLHSSWNLYDKPITCISLTYFLILLKQYLQRNHWSTAVLGKRLCSISFLLIPWNGIPWSLLVFLLWVNYGWLSTCSKLITPRRLSKIMHRNQTPGFIHCLVPWNCSVFCSPLPSFLVNAGDRLSPREDCLYGKVLPGALCFPLLC